jgi:hypothetical protein
MELIINKFTSLAEAEAHIAVIDNRLRLFKQPWAASTGETRAQWQAVMDAELDLRQQLTAAIRALKTNVKPATATLP